MRIWNILVRMRIIIIGPQGSGKGTQADLLSKKYSIAHISTGNILRENVENKTELGKLAEEYMNRGQLVPAEPIVKIIDERIKRNDCKNGFILDGYPRNIKQAEKLDDITGIDYVLEIVVSDRESIRRITGRRSCKCGAVYHTFYNPPKIPGKCDKCRSELFQRDDDKEETVRKRLEIYHEETEKLIEFYKDKHIRINGEQPIEDVFREILEKLSKRT